MSNSARKSKSPEPEPTGFPGDSALEAALGAVRRTRPAVLAAIVGVQGSSPREVGARMLVTEEAISGSVGGGVLEHMVIQRARTLLRQPAARHALLSFPLGPDSQQCCGGVVTLFLEPLCADDEIWLQQATAAAISRKVGVVTRLGDGSRKLVVDPKASPAGLPPGADRWFRQATGADACLCREGAQEFLCQILAPMGFQVALFGAGHVGRAIAAALAAHRCRILWIDPREQEFPETIPDNARVLVCDDVSAALGQVPAGSMVLVMTHRHPLDYEICRRALASAECAFLGLIGSATKRRRFAKALVRDGIAEQAVERLCCPIGIPGLKGKEPAVIAASVVAQLLMEAGRHFVRQKATGIGERDGERSCIAASF